MDALFDDAKCSQFISTYNIKFSPEREKLHRKIVEERLVVDTTLPTTTLLTTTLPTTTLPTSQFIFTAGCFGAGKSHVVRHLNETQPQRILNLDKFVVIDPDELRYQIPEIHDYIRENPYTAGERTHTEACYLCDLLILICLAQGRNIIVDGSMQNWIWYKNDFIPFLRKEHPTYTISIIRVCATFETAAGRCVKRGLQTGRMIDVERLKAVFEKVRISYEHLVPVVDFVCTIENETTPCIPSDIAFPSGWL